MRIFLIIMALTVTSYALGIDDKSMKDLFTKYDLVMNEHKTEYIDEVFSKEFINEEGKAALIKKIKSIPLSKDKVKGAGLQDWKKGRKGEIYFAKYKSKESVKEKSSHEAQFVIVVEDGKPKINGTMSDAD